MSMMAYNSAAGLGGMLPAGSRHYGQDNDNGNGSVVLRNIDACLQLSRMLRTSMGPHGRCKLVVNHLGLLTVTSDCASIVKQVEVVHPAAQLLAAACQKQEQEVGDNTNFCLALGGELLFETAKLIGKMTWTPGPEIIKGYQMALQACVEDYLPALTVPTSIQVDNRQDVIDFLCPVLASKQYGSQHVLAPLVTDACHQVAARNSAENNKMTSIPVEAVRTLKILGASVNESKLLSGFVGKSGVVTVTQQADIHEGEDSCRIVVFACGFEASSTEAKGTVLMKNADELLNYNKTEESKMQDIVQSLVNAKIKVVVTGGNVSDMALHFMDRAGLVCWRTGSKWELRRLCQAISATALVRLGAPTPEEIGHARRVVQTEVGGKTLTIFETEKSSKITTILLRASTNTVLNDLERAVDDGVHAFSNAVKDGGHVVYGGGAIEMALSLRLQEKAASTPGLEQYALQAFATALQVVPRTLAENAGLDPVTVAADLLAAHTAAGTDTLCDVGVDIESEKGTCTTTSMKDKKVVDLLSTKLSALQLAVDAVVTILKIDQIIMSKPAGGPKPQG